MGFFNDMAVALDNYPTDEVVLSIVDVALHSGTGSSINVGETYKCKVLVENTGHINMTGVTVHVLGTSGVEVSLSPTTGFTTGTVTPGPMTVNGGGSQRSAYVYFKSNVVKPAGSQLLEVHFDGWTGGNFDHMFSNHTQENLHDPRGTYSAQVHAS